MTPELLFGVDVNRNGLVDPNEAGRALVGVDAKAVERPRVAPPTLLEDSKAFEQRMEQMRGMPIEQLGFATLDLHRAVRRGFPEVVYGAGKTVAQIVGIVQALRRAGQIGGASWREGV